MRKSILSIEDAAWLTETFERNRQLYAGWSMEGDDDAPKDDDADDGGDDQDDDADDDSGDKDKDDDTNSLEYWKRRSRQNEREARKWRNQAEGKSTKPPAKSEKGDDPDPAKIREEAREEARREVLRERIEDKIEAKAGAFGNARLAVLALLDQHDHDDFLDGDKIDVEAITDALKELGEKQPNLLAQGGKKFKGDPDNGPRKEAPSRPKSLGDAVANYYKPRK